MSKLAIAIGAILFPSVAAAHPEHAAGGSFGLVHYLSDPFHVALTGAAILLMVGVWQWRFRRQPARVELRGSDQ